MYTIHYVQMNQVQEINTDKLYMFQTVNNEVTRFLNKHNIIFNPQDFFSVTDLPNSSIC